MNNIEITYGSNTITADQIAYESFRFSDSLCSEKNLRYGACEASSIKVRIRNIGSIVGEVITVRINGHEWKDYKVVKDKLTADRCYRDIEAYDKMYDILNADVAEWYNFFFDGSKRTLLDLRTGFFAYLGIQQESVDLVNDDLAIGKTLDVESLSGKTVVTAICELNGCFGHIVDGKFRYITLQPISNGLAPASDLEPSDGLTPRTTENVTIIPASQYSKVTFEDWGTELVDKIQIRQDPDDIGGIYGTGNNCYVIQDNFLCYGRATGELQNIAQNIFSVIGGVWYTPATISAIANLALEVGDGIQVQTNNGAVNTYILERELKGILSMHDTYYAEGDRFQGEKVDSVNDQITRIAGKTARLTRTVEELNSQINDERAGLQSQITQNANAIKSVVKQSFNGNMVAESMIHDKYVFPKDEHTADNTPIGGIGFRLNRDVRGAYSLGKFTISGGQTYTLSFLSRSDDWQWAYPEIYLVIGSQKIWLDMMPSSLTYDWWFSSVTFTAPISTDSAYIQFEESSGMDFFVCDIMLSTGDVPLSWVPNRAEEYSMIYQTAGAIEAKVERTGGDAASFAWSLTTDGFRLISNGNTVFDCDSQGITVAGYAKAETLEAQVARIDRIESDYVTTGQLNAQTAKIDELKADVASLSSAVIKKLDVDTANANYATITNLNATTERVRRIESDYVKAGAINVNTISAMFNSPNAGSLTLGTVRTANLFIYDGQYNRYLPVSRRTVKIDGQTIQYLGW